MSALKIRNFIASLLVVTVTLLFNVSMGYGQAEEDYPNSSALKTKLKAFEAKLDSLREAYKVPGPATTEMFSSPRLRSSFTKFFLMNSDMKRATREFITPENDYVASSI